MWRRASCGTPFGWHISVAASSGERGGPADGSVPGSGVFGLPGMLREMYAFTPYYGISIGRD